MALDNSIFFRNTGGAGVPSLMDALNSGIQASQAIKQAPLMNELMRQKVQAGQMGIDQNLQAQQSQQLEAQKAQKIQAGQFVNRLTGEMLNQSPSERALTVSKNADFIRSIGEDPATIDTSTENLTALNKATSVFNQQASNQSVQSSESLPGGITKIVTRDGNILVKDAGGKMIGGQDAIQAVQAAEERKAELERNIALGRSSGSAEGTNTETRQQEAIQQGIAAAPSLVDVNRGLELLSQVETGGLSAKGKAVSAFFGTTSGDIGELNKILAQDMLNTIQSFPGSLSEGELNVINSISASLSQGKEVNQRILIRLKQVLETKVSRGKRLAQDRGDLDALDTIEESLSYGGQRSNKPVEQDQAKKNNNSDAELFKKYGIE